MFYIILIVKQSHEKQNLRQLIDATVPQSSIVVQNY